MDLMDLRDKLDEDNYPYYTDQYLTSRLEGVVDEDSYRALIRELLLKKADIPAIKLGDVEIPSPKNHFMTLAFQYRQSMTGTVVRADGRE
jgi:hypothetical protein